MFTGIVTDVGRIKAIEQSGDGRIEIATAYDAGDIALGASIACSGVCLTVVERRAAEDGAIFAVTASDETRRCTSIGNWQVDGRVNLERALKVGDELGGHIVSGHVDGVGRIRAIEPEAQSLRFTFEAPADLLPYIAEKGSIAVDGVSLTVNRVLEDAFTVNIIPYTQQETTFTHARAGDPVNLEVDVMARYVARLAEAKTDWAPHG